MTINSQNFCIAPWVNIHINQVGGETRPCCGGGSEFQGKSLGSISKNDWSYIQGTNLGLANLRREMLSGKKPDYCVGCVEKDWYREFLRYQDEIDFSTDLKWQHLKSMDVRWGTTCQLSCMYCNQSSSSTWALLENRNKSIPIQSSRSFRDQYNEIYELLKEHGEKIERVSLLGGEPLLLPENATLLDLMPNATVEIFSNLNIASLATNKVYQKLKNRYHVKWYISMENIQDRFEFVRRGSDWNQQVSNIKTLFDGCLDIDNIRVHGQYCVYSALNMQELYDFFSDFPLASIDWNILTDPKPLDIFNFPRFFVEKAITEINNVVQKHRNRSFQLQSILPRLESMSSGDDRAVETCLRWHDDMESRYFNKSKNFSSLWPQYNLDYIP
jgi:organic radical activating enzyme